MLLGLHCQYVVDAKCPRNRRDDVGIGAGDQRQLVAAVAMTVDQPPRLLAHRGSRGVP
jgi:hypothetical protein